MHCDDCGHDADSHDLRGWYQDSRCEKDCEECLAESTSPIIELKSECE